MSKYSNFKQVTEKATKVAKSWTNQQKVFFHLYNPNGASAYKRRVDALISEAVGAGLIPSGWILAYGGLNTYHEDRLIELSRKGKVSSFEARWYAEKMIAEADKAEAKLKEALGEE